MNRSALTAALVACAALLFPGVPARAGSCASAGHVGGDWPFYGRDYANTRHQAEEKAIGSDEAAALAPAWSFSSRGAGGDGDFTGTPVVSEGCVFVGSNTGWVFAVNADTGQSVWATRLASGGTVNSTLAVSGGRVFASVSRVGTPYVSALDADTGEILWETTVDTQEGADLFASPIVFDGAVFVGISGDAAQHGDEGQRFGFHGSFVLLDERSGAILRKTWTIPPEEWDQGYAGATVSTTPAIDTIRKIAYVGTASAYQPQYEHPRADALLKVDVDPASPSFGAILDSYKGNTFDDVVPGYSSLPCMELPTEEPPPIVPTGRGVGACGDVDVDFAASPNLVVRPGGRSWVGDSQKSGVYHMVDAETMDGVWTTTFAPAQPFGGVSAAYDGESIYGGAAPPGHLFSLDPETGELGWTAPVADGPHYGLPVASANGVVYTLDVKGFLDAYDSATGIPLLHRPMALGASTGADPVLTFGGVSVARNTVYAAVGIQNTGLDFLNVMNGYVIAFRPAP